MSKQLKSSNKGTQQQNFSLKCVKSLQKCVKDLKRAMRQMQFESQRIQKHQIQQILNNSNNLLTALTSCNLYRIHFQEEQYYLTQLQKIEKGIGEILEFVSQICNRKFFTGLGNNKQCEDLFNQLETTFDTFVGPLLHIFNTFNVAWLLFQCDPLKLFLLDEFNEEAIITKLGIADYNNSDAVKETSITGVPKEGDIQREDIINSEEIIDEQKKNLSQKGVASSGIGGGSPCSNNYSINIIQPQKSINKILALKANNKQEGPNGRKQFLTELLNEYKQIVPENTCLSELAILIDYTSNQNPNDYQKVFLEYYVQLFDYSTSEKISNILHKTHDFDRLNKYCSLIFYNSDIMRLSSSEIIHYLHSSTSFQLKDLHLKLLRSGFNPLPVPVTSSPIIQPKKGTFRNQQFHFQSSNQSLQKQNEDKNDATKSLNQHFSSSNFKVGEAITLCPHQSNFFSLAPRVEGKGKHSKNKNEEICCQYVKQQRESQQYETDEEDDYVMKRSHTVSQRRSELYTSQLTTDILNFQKSIQLKHQNTLAIGSIQDIKEDDEEEKKESESYLLKKRELLFGRKAKNSILKPDFFFEENEFSISRQQFKITYEDQSNEYNIQCMSHSSLTQLVIDDIGFELTVGSVFIIQDLIAFQVVGLKQFPEQSQFINNSGVTINSNSKVIANKAAPNQQNVGSNSPLLEKDHQAKKQLYKSRSKGGRLSYKNSQLFEEYENTQTSSEQQRGQDVDTAKNTESPSSSSDSEEEHNDKEFSNSLSENESINSSIASISSISCIMANTNQIQHQFDKRTSLNTKKNSFINSIRQQNSQQNSRKGSVSIMQNNSNLLAPDQNYFDASQTGGVTPNNALNEIPSPNQLKTPETLKYLKTNPSIEAEVNSKQQIKNNSILSSDAPQINLVRAESELEEVTQDFKKSSQAQSEKQSNLGMIQQSTLMNGMSISTSRLMLQSNLNQMNQSAYSIAGQSLYELEEDPLASTDALLHIRVLWSSIDTEKEDYLFQYNNTTDRESIVINFGSDKENHIRIQDENKAIKAQAHCTIAYQDDTWMIMTNHDQTTHYSGLALKKIEEIENGLVSKKILIDKGFSILVQGYIFNCNL